MNDLETYLGKLEVHPKAIARITAANSDGTAAEFAADLARARRHPEITMPVAVVIEAWFQQRPMWRGRS